LNGFSSEFKDDSSQSIGFSFIRAYNIWHRRIKSGLLPLGITHPQFVVLASLGYLSQQGAAIRQTDIAKTADIDVMTVSTILRNLEKLGHVSRSDSPTDTRAKQVVLTKTGSAVLEEALGIVESIDRDFFAPLGQRKSDLNKLLHRLAAL
jgi:DNA-binding MarR family transcriptional regulator